jgi:tetratricopeptide (TPR) repeat protein
MPKRAFFPYISILILIFVVYGNTFTAPWFFDDIPNIVNNPPLNIDNLMPGTLWQTFFAKPFNPGNLYRPIACLSFALNWLVGQDNTMGYHIVNVGIHGLSAVFLYLIVMQLYQTPALKDSQLPEGVYFTALLAVVLWAGNPIQTQAVTYIVQRMASLAGMFYAASIYGYISGRLETTRRLQVRYFLVCVLSFIMALGSKENAVLLPISLLLIEYIFFIMQRKNVNKIYLRILALISILILSAGLVYLHNKGLFAHFFNQSGSRPFSPYERLLTESRVLFFYLSLIFYPVPSRLSIDHDFLISTSLFSPWTTALSITTILMLLIIALLYIKKEPIISFALLFFFLNHLVESTIFPLELVFEHRNYIPSFFLFLPIASGLYWLLTHYALQNRIIYISIILFISLLISVLGTGTYIRNMTYASSGELWRDTLQKAPLSARALSNLGINAGWKQERSLDKLREALFLNHKALSSYQQRVTFKPTILLNMGNLLFNYGLYDQAIEQYKRSLALKPHFTDARYHLAQAYIKKGDFSQALEQITTVIENASPKSLYFNVHGLALLWMQEPEEALLSFRKAMYLVKDKQIAYYHIGTALSLSGYHDQAIWFLEKARNKERNNIRIAFSILENSVRANDPAEILKNAQYVFSNFDLKTIARAIEILPNEYSSVPVDTNLIKPVIASTVEELAMSLFVDEKVEAALIGD